MLHFLVAIGGEGLGGGFGFALAVVAFATGRAVWRPRHPPAPPPPLTPERLADKRREFFFLNMAGSTIVILAGMGWKFWPTLDRDYPIVIVAAFAMPLAAYIYCVIMWQFYGTALEVAEKKRLQREARAAQAKNVQTVGVPTPTDA